MAHHSTELARCVADNVVMKIIPQATEPIKSEYFNLVKAFEDVPEYVPFFLIHMRLMTALREESG